MTSQTINLNLIPGGIEPIIHVSQYDKGQTWTFNIYSGSQSFSIPSGANVSIRGTKPDNNGFAYDCTYSGNAVTATEQQQMTAVAGKVAAEIVITKNSEMIGSANFVINVEKAALDSDTPISDTEIPAIIELAQEQAEDAEAWAKGTKNGQAVPSTAEQYHNNAKYWAEQASGSAADALKSEGYAVGKQNGTDVASGSPYYHNNSKYYSEQAASSASTASTKASQASTSATNAANSATSASGSATTATQKATAAANSATAAANSATAAQQAAASLTVDSALSSTSTNPVQNKIVKGEFDSVKQALTNEVVTRATLGAHNLLPMSLSDIISLNNTSSHSWSGNVDTYYNGPEFTVNTDANGNVTSIKVNGTTTAVTLFALAQVDFGNTAFDTYSTPTASGYTISEPTAKTSNFKVYYETSTKRVLIRIASGQTLNNTMLYPMVRLATDPNTEFTPYVPTNSQLLSYKDNGVLGAKNAFICPDSSGTNAGITVTRNADDSFTIAAGTTTGFFYIPQEQASTFTRQAQSLLPNTTYTFSIGTSNENIRLGAFYKVANGSWVEQKYSDFGASELTITTPSSFSHYWIRLQAASGKTLPAMTFKPMIRLATDTDPTYQPYAMTNKELTDSKAEKSDLASISITGTTNSTGSTITIGTYFYLNGTLVRAKAAIANGATLTKDTNYEVVTAGGLNSVPHFLTGTVTDMQALPIDGTITDYTIPEDGYYGGYAVNDDVAGNVNLVIMDSAHSKYIFSGSLSQSANYQRVACPPIPLRKGAVITFRAWATNRAYVYKMT